MPEDNPNTAALEARNLTCLRGGRTVFSSLSFKVAPGSALILKGSNGSGKTSLLRILSGLLSLEEGEVCWAGLSGKDAIATLQENIHLIGHLTALKPVLSVGENISLWARLHGQSSGVESAIQSMGLGELADLPVRFLSEGQKRRVALARLTAHSKKVWLLDEPLAGLDKPSASRLIDVVHHHLRSGGIAIIATHQALQLESSLQSEILIGEVS